jgi:hypothetical protein
LCDGAIRDNILKFILRTEIYLQKYGPACKMVEEILRRIGNVDHLSQLNPIRRAKKKKRLKGELEEGEVEEEDEDPEMAPQDPRLAPYSRFSTAY